MKPSSPLLIISLPFISLCLLAINVFCASRLSLASVSIKQSESQIAALTRSIDTLKSTTTHQLSMNDLHQEAVKRHFVPPDKITTLHSDSLAFYAP